MASSSKIGRGMTLEEFLRWPRIDEKPYKEYIDGRIENKVSPQAKHSVLTLDFCLTLNQFASPSRLGRAFPELRCTFGGRSIIPDVVLLLREHIHVDNQGCYVDEVFVPPDIHVEILSPKQSMKKTREKLDSSIRDGCPLGWFIHPYQRWIEVYRPGLPAERLPADGFLDGSPVLPGFRIPVSEVFGWLTYQQPDPTEPGGDPS